MSSVFDKEWSSRVCDGRSTESSTDAGGNSLGAKDLTLHVGLAIIRHAFIKSG